MKPKSTAKAHELLPLTPTEEEILKVMSTYRYMTAVDVAALVPFRATQSSFYI